MLGFTPFALFFVISASAIAVTNSFFAPSLSLPRSAFAFGSPSTRLIALKATLDNTNAVRRIALMVSPDNTKSVSLTSLISDVDSDAVLAPICDDCYYLLTSSMATPDNSNSVSPTSLMKELKDLGLDVSEGTVAIEGAVKQAKMFTALNGGRKVDDPDMLERIRLTIANNLLKYHPVPSDWLAMVEAFGVNTPVKKIALSLSCHSGLGPIIQSCRKGDGVEDDGVSSCSDETTELYGYPNSPPPPGSGDEVESFWNGGFHGGDDGGDEEREGGKAPALPEVEKKKEKKKKTKKRKGEEHESVKPKRKKKDDDADEGSSRPTPAAVKSAKGRSARVSKPRKLMIK